ncbi:adenosylcobinamide kinase /adenosylcobinamide-phosphate guanylyltransferase [Acetitomaculum ruminis DSM 5522]|uniref:Adenosylcobinamide kinase /adenosylcobinamide-phosphate guanylyltransferase n=1 Tax=Acetitomaculum ruminis DSM 5522 TaxID=1120918 RepID=A0A1I0WVP4_9FIRM|nr:bifunctional adenosylcobinamide kinase/adenosylcobinamide-phosphate guanylyltransferase [Acetitomaculum ruminis]SFA92721.1 adenosylcobinamide kinase /adenosylcobinamide-phosphate guanylyltransferase [Acetitomaculum ruminis DSM 5522]
MWLITGGAFQGKLNFALEKTGFSKEDIVDGEKCDIESIYQGKIINNFHTLIKRLIKDGKDPKEVTETVIKNNPDAIIIINEVGNGIVPIDALERQAREATGRCGTILAQNSKKVYRVLCGIGTCIKG